MSSDDSSSHRGLSGSRPEIALVAALDEHRVIGRGGRLPWHLPADLRHFKEVTVGHPVIMGRKTYESIGKPLPGRLNIVLTRQRDYEASGCVVVSGLDEAIEEVDSANAQRAMVIGGSGVFRQALPRADVMYLTIVHGHYDGDTYFPEFASEQWEVVERKSRAADEENEADMTFVELRRSIKKPRSVAGGDEPGPLPEILETR